MRNILLIICCSLLVGCATIRTVLAANPEAVVVGIIIAEEREGVRCASANQAGQAIDQSRVAHLAYARLGADATLLHDLGDNFLRNVNVARTMTDQLCGTVIRVPLTEIPVSP